MSEKTITVVDENGKELVFNIETDPNYIPAYEYQDEDGNWTLDNEEEEAK